MLEAVELVKDSGDLLDLYCTVYEKKYRIKPILSPNGTDQTLARDLIRQHGVVKAKLLIEAFLQCDYWTFNQNKHSLQSLLKNINVVNVEVEKFARKQEHKTPQVLKLRIQRYCDVNGCNTLVDWIGESNDFISQILCERCREGLPLLKPTLVESLYMFLDKQISIMPYGYDKPQEYAVKESLIYTHFFFYHYPMGTNKGHEKKEFHEAMLELFPSPHATYSEELDTWYGFRFNRTFRGVEKQ